jgi:hypothetical protein
VNRCSVWFSSLKKPKIRKKLSKIKNRRFDRENREPDQLNRFCPSSSYSKTSRFCSFFPNLKPIFFIFSLPSSVLTPPLPFSLCLSVSHSHVLTSSFSQSHLPLAILTVSQFTGDSHGLTVSIFHRLTLVACDLTAASGFCSRSAYCS